MNDETPVPFAGTSETRQAAGDPLWSAAAQQAAAILAQAKADVARRQEAVLVLSRLSRAFVDNNADGVARVLADPKLRSAVDGYPEFRPALERLRLASQGASRGRVDTLLNEVESYAADRGWSTRRSEGGLRVAHLLWVKPDSQGHTKVQSKSVRSLTWESVRPVLDAEYDRVWGRAERRALDLPNAFHAAVAAVQSEASREAGYVRLRSVYNYLKGRLPKEPGRVASYYRDEFSADLSTVMERQTRTDAGPRFELSAARDPELAHEVITPDGELALAGYIRVR